MAWYPGARKMELQPESDSQPAIRPTQFILHSIAAPWDENRIYEYWRDSTNLESHFGLDYDGSIGQFIGTETRADACYLANRRPDGTGAVSIETASNLKHTDPWTPEQVEQLIRLGVWLHKTHGIPLRICRTASDPGFGYHRLHADWAVSGTDCPGDARVAQFKTVVFPGIVARATGTQEEDEMEPVDVWAYRNKRMAEADPKLPDAYGFLYGSFNLVRALTAKVDALTAKVASLEKTGLTPEQITAIANEVADAHARRLAE